MLSQAMLPSSTAPPVKNAMLEVRRSFIQKVYSILTVQLLITVAIGGSICIKGMEHHEWLVENRWLMLVSMYGSLAFVLAMTCCRQAISGFPMNYICLAALTVLEGVTLGFVCATQKVEIVLLAAGLTVLIFASLTAYAFVSQSDFTGAGPYLAAAVMCMLVFAAASMLMQWLGMDIKPMVMLYSALGVILFSFYIVYDTQLMLGEFKGHKFSYSIDDYCDAALALYLDIINLFIDILSLLGDNRD